MAAMRSALAMLGRRGCASSGSSGAAAVCGRGLEIHRVLCPAAPPPPPFLRQAVGNLQGRRCFSTVGGEPGDRKEAENVFRMYWQLARARVKNRTIVEECRAFLLFLSAAVVFGIFNFGSTLYPTPFLRGPKINTGSDGKN